ncbi:uncharacterized protein MKZ38_003670 [Zalerion maritima]|uniref:RecA family profile 1 domain-containing protein n=1 Tax=Zalerion maritima TaxID=339359 RepID=A0AAD5WQH1_9PEZI|nr:uncharacterized protein MKZ38_003670 [Zalerion maritima]
MSDLRDILPRFPAAQYSNLLAVLEKHNYTTTDLLVLEAAEIGKRTKLPLLDLQRLGKTVLAALHEDLEVSPFLPPPPPPPAPALGPGTTPAPGATSSRFPIQHEATTAPLAAKNPTPKTLRRLPPFNSISTLCPTLDSFLSDGGGGGGGGIPAGYVTEISGESGAGKTQFLLSLLLSVQLPPPYGLGRPAIYISTEAPLATTRLEQILNNNPLLKDIRRQQWADGTMLAEDENGDGDGDGDGEGNEEGKLNPAPAPAPKLGTGIGPLKYPSLDGILSTTTPDLESQEHILNFQVPVEISRRNTGLLVLDSVAANFRAEFERGGAASTSAASAVAAAGLGSSAKNQSHSMGARSNDLVKLGYLLRELARKHSMAIVVSNQVSDRISDGAPRLAAMSSNHRNRNIVAATAGAAGGSTSTTRFPESPLASRSRGIPGTPGTPGGGVEPKSSIDTSGPLQPTPDWAEQLQLDHQQRWFSGWGDDPDAQFQSKTPSLGLVWSTQISCRIALIKLPSYFGAPQTMNEDDWERDADGALIPKSAAASRKTWRRWMKVVFAPHVKSSGQGLDGAAEYDITTGGLKGHDIKAKDTED